MRLIQLTAPSLALLTFALAPTQALAQGTKADYERSNSLRSSWRDKVFKVRVNAHWFGANQRFWYRNDVRGSRQFIVVDAVAGSREPAFDHNRLAAALSAAAGVDYSPKHLPFDEIAFAAADTAVLFEVDDTKWSCDLSNYECTRAGPAEPNASSRGERRPGRNRGNGRRRGNRRGLSPRQPLPSPDGAWRAVLREHNVYLSSTGDEREFRLSHDGTEDRPYSAPTWSPDSRVLVAYRTRPGNVEDVHLIESSPRDQLRAKHRTRPYSRPGDEFPSYEMSLFSVATKEGVRVDAEAIDFRGPPRLRWKRDGQRFTYEKRDRGHQRNRILEVDVATGKTRTILDERSDTFLDDYHKRYVRYLDDGREILWASERDGWNHLYLYDGEKGQLKNQVTRGPWVMRGVDHVDEENRQVWFRASGMNPGQDPYLVHFYRIGFDGTGLVGLTEGDGHHTLTFSPDRRHFIDTYSRVDAPPVTELRRSSDGSLVCVLETADIADLTAAGWRAPEVFSAKGRDGETDIWGIIVRPTNFDATASYPVIESIYAGPHDSHVPKTFSAYRSVHAMAELGFIVVQIDGMGTNNRSKAFHDVCWQNLADAGFPDRIAWMRAAAARYPCMDLDRVGIYGTSAGGQNALGALLFHPEFYHVAMAACGCHDNRLDKASWNEQWMGYPVGRHYEEQSNITNAHRLQGKLFLIVGELDSNVPPESTLRVVDALIKADKDFDLLFVPGMQHGSGGAYGNRRTKDFFVRHLLGVEPRWQPGGGGVPKPVVR